MNSKLLFTTAITAVESKMFLVQTETKDQYEESPQIFESEVDVVTESNGENLFESEVGPDSSEKVLMNVDISKWNWYIFPLLSMNVIRIIDYQNTLKSVICT